MGPAAVTVSRPSPRAKVNQPYQIREMVLIVPDSRVNKSPAGELVSPLTYDFLSLLRMKSGIY